MTCGRGEFLGALIDLDIDHLLRHWKHISPNMPQPTSRQDVLAAAHHARTMMPSVPAHIRYYSHRWLVDHDLPSMLPDNLRPAAERMYPREVVGVGIAVKSRYEIVRRAITGAMENAVLEAYADGHKNQPGIVKGRMMEARERERRGLMLPTLRT